jgi:hypothetical protein
MRSCRGIRWRSLRRVTNATAFSKPKIERLLLLPLRTSASLSDEYEQLATSTDSTDREAKDFWRRDTVRLN